jgi:hypothetical protein
MRGMPRRRPRHKNKSECRKKMISQGPGYDTEARARFNGEACRREVMRHKESRKRCIERHGEMLQTRKRGHGQWRMACFTT